MTTRPNTFLALILSLTIGVSLGCSFKVPLRKVYGTYKAAYPFGTELITLNRDGTFDQQVELNGQARVDLHGAWNFDDAKESRVELKGLAIVVDGFGNLRSTWRTEAPSFASTDIEMHWFKLVMGSGARYPYEKQ